MMKKNKGITLVALVVTIIVLLLLAGVSIEILTRENGIITKVIESSNQTYIAQIREGITVDLMAVISENDGKSVTEEQVNNILSQYDKEGKSDRTNEAGERIVLTDKGVAVTVSGLLKEVLPKKVKFSIYINPDSEPTFEDEVPEGTTWLEYVGSGDQAEFWRAALGGEVPVYMAPAVGDFDAQVIDWDIVWLTLGGRKVSGTDVIINGIYIFDGT